MKRFIPFVLVVLALAVLLGIPRERAEAVDTNVVSLGLLDTLETVQGISDADAYFSNIQLIPGGTSTSSPIEVDIYTSLDGRHWSLFTTFTDAIAVGVSDTILSAYLGAVRGVKCTSVTWEADSSVTITPYVMEVKD